MVMDVTWDSPFLLSRQHLTRGLTYSSLCLVPTPCSLSEDSHPSRDPALGLPFWDSGPRQSLHCPRVSAWLPCGSAHLHSPHRLVQRVEEFEAEAVLLGGALDKLAAVQQHCAHPLAHLGCLVDEQHPWLQHTPQLRPALQGPSDLREDSRSGSPTGAAPWAVCAAWCGRADEQRQGLEVSGTRRSIPEL